MDLQVKFSKQARKEDNNHIMKIALINPNEFKKILMSKGYSQRSFAESCEISSPYINQIINGEKFPSGKIAKKIVDALELEFNDIFFIKDAY